MCRTNYEEDDRIPHCDEDGICSLTKEAPFVLFNKNKLSWDVYCDISNISNPCMMGLPTIDKIDFYFEHTELELTQTEYEDLMEKLMLINQYRRSLLSKKMERQRK